MKKLWFAICNFFRALAGKAAKKMSDPVRDQVFAIEDAEKEHQDFETAIAELIAENNEKKRKLDLEKNEVQKWGNISKDAASKGNREDAETALKNQIKAEQKVKDIQVELEASKKEADSLRDQLEAYEDRIRDAEANSAKFAARLKGANIRQKIATSGNRLDGIFTGLNALEAEANHAVDLADAHGQLNTDPNSELVKKYSSGNDAELQSRLNNLMNDTKIKQDVSDLLTK